MSILFKHIFIVVAFITTQLSARTIDSLWIVANYTKIEKMVPMRDGVKLFTAIKSLRMQVFFRH
jgi:hypothetical protein